MGDFLMRQAERALGTAPLIEPRLPSLYGAEATSAPTHLEPFEPAVSERVGRARQAVAMLDSPAPHGHPARIEIAERGGSVDPAERRRLAAAGEVGDVPPVAARAGLARGGAQVAGAAPLADGDVGRVGGDGDAAAALPAIRDAADPAHVAAGAGLDAVTPDGIARVGQVTRGDPDAAPVGSGGLVRAAIKAAGIAGVARAGGDGLDAADAADRGSLTAGASVAAPGADGFAPLDRRTSPAASLGGRAASPRGVDATALGAATSAAPSHRVPAELAAAEPRVAAPPAAGIPARHARGDGRDLLPAELAAAAPRVAAPPAAGMPARHVRGDGRDLPPGELADPPAAAPGHDFAAASTAGGATAAAPSPRRAGTGGSAAAGSPAGFRAGALPAAGTSAGDGVGGSATAGSPRGDGAVGSTAAAPPAAGPSGGGDAGASPLAGSPAGVGVRASPVAGSPAPGVAGGRSFAASVSRLAGGGAPPPAAPEPVVRVSVGRIEVRGPGAVAPVPPAWAPGLSLDAYLTDRGGIE